MELPIFVVNAFAAGPFSGNPAAVLLHTEHLSDELMQQIAAQMNLSETAFPVREGTAFMLRWFTPTNEVNLCGHATLATAEVLYKTGLINADEPIEFHTLSGVLRASREGELIVLDFPTSQLQPAKLDDEISAALGCPVLDVFFNGDDFFVRTDSAETVRNLKPKLGILAEVKSRGFCITAESDEEGIDFVSRFFGPAVGIPEDPVTGSAHCALAPYWAEILGKETFVARQVSSRGGKLLVELKGDRTILKGRAEVCLSGRIATD